MFAAANPTPPTHMRRSLERKRPQIGRREVHSLRICHMASESAVMSQIPLGPDLQYGYLRVFQGEKNGA
jgi:hypothetical protein